MFRTIVNQLRPQHDTGANIGFAVFVTNKRYPDAKSILLKKDNGRTDEETGETGTDDPEGPQQGEPNDTAEILFYDVVGKDWSGGGIDAHDIAQALSKAGRVGRIRLFINSPGGDSTVGVTIYNMLTRHQAEVETVIDGLAASAASVIAMAGDRRIARTGSVLMIHPASMLTVGNAEEHEKSAEILEKFDQSIVDLYAEATGLPEKRIRDMMQAETWMTASDALEAGFVHEVQGRAAVKKTSVGNQAFVVANGVRWPSNAVRSAPASAAPAPRVPSQEELRKKEAERIKMINSLIPHVQSAEGRRVLQGARDRGFGLMDVWDEVLELEREEKQLVHLAKERGERLLGIRPASDASSKFSDDPDVQLLRKILNVRTPPSRVVEEDEKPNPGQEEFDAAKRTSESGNPKISYDEDTQIDFVRSLGKKLQ